MNYGAIPVATAGALAGWLLLVPASLQVAPPSQIVDGKLLFANHCAACHGDAGDGNGIAARFLYPKPRDFTSAEFRLVSTTNLVPTDGPPTSPGALRITAPATGQQLESASRVWSRNANYI